MKLIRNIADKDFAGDNRLSDAAPRLAARAILIDENGHIALMYDKKFSFHTLPGGGVEAGEEIIDAVKREILEETGCCCEIVDELGYVYENRASHNFTQNSYYFIANVIGIKGSPHLTQEEINTETIVEWYTLNDAIEIISSPAHSTLQRKFIQCRDMAVFAELQKSNRLSSVELRQAELGGQP